MADVLELSVEVRNKALNKAWREKGTNNKVYLYIDGIQGSPEPQFVEAQFTLASGGVVNLSYPVAFPIQAGTTINQIGIDTRSSGGFDNLGLITLEAGEIEVYNENGTYTIGTLSIALINE